MAQHAGDGAPGAETRRRMLRALQDAVTRAGGARRVSGLSLIAALCASAVVPVALVGPVIGSAWDAWLATVGSIGSNVLADVILTVVGRRSPDAAGDAQSVELAVAGELEARMADSGAEAAELRGAVAAVLRELGAQQVLAEAMADGDGELQTGLAASMAVLAQRFAEFAPVGEQTHRAVLEINASLQEQQALLRTQDDRLREQSLMLLQVLETMRPADAEREAGGGSGGEAVWPGCPYMGLLPFGRREAQIFYGRKDLTSRLCQALAERVAGGGLLVVTGASGAGKSSLLSAGLLPALSRDVLVGSGRWPRRMLTPASAPLDELSVVLADLVGKRPQEVLASLSFDPARAADLAAEGVSAAVRESAMAARDGASPPRLVLIVDQFEELFTRTSSDDAGLAQRAAFIEALYAAATVPIASTGRPAALVVVSIRGDFLDQAFAYPALAQAPGRPFVVGPMTEAELRSTITGPAAEARLRVEPELVDEIMRQLRRQPGSVDVGRALLPLVSEVMAATWEKREGDRLTLRAYQRAGGVSDAVNNGAQGAYESLQERLQPVARALFLRLTLVGVDGRVARRRASRAELYRATGHPRDRVDMVIEAFAARRLLVLERDDVEIPHDALLWSWSELQGWLDEDRGDRVVYGRLSLDAQSWHERGEDRAYLYAGGRLEEIARVQERWETDPERYPVPSPKVTRFLEAGRVAEDARLSRRRRTVIGLTVLALVATGAAVGASIAADSARRNAAAVRAESAVAVSRELAAEALNLDATNPYTARQLASAAWALSPTTEAGHVAAALLNEQSGTLVTPDQWITSMAFNPTGTLLVTAGHAGDIRLWDPATAQQVGTTIALPGHSVTGGDNSIAFNPAGTVLATPSSDGVLLWNPTTHQQIGTIDARALVNGVAFNPAGTVLATAGSEGVLLWNAASHQEIGIILSPSAPGAGVTGLRFNAAGTLLATASDDGTVRLWNPNTHQQVGTTIAAASANGRVVHGVNGFGGISDLAFNPAGTLLATAGGDGSVRLWNPSTHQQIGTTITADADAGGFVNSVAFNPAGTLLATAGRDGTVRMWNPANGQQVGTTIAASGNSADATGVAFDPAGNLLATAGGDGAVRLWNPTTHQQIGNTLTTAGNGSAVNAVAFNAAGTLLATANDDGTIRLWNTTTHQQIGTTISAITAADGFVLGVAFNPAGTLLATADSDGTIRLWNPSTDQQTGTISAAVPSNGNGVMGVVFDSAGTLLASAGADGTVRLWNPTTGLQVGTTITETEDEPFSSTSSVAGVAFNPAGTLLATASQDGTVRLWNPSNQQQVSTITAFDYQSSYGPDPVNGVAFNPAGTLLATADSEGTVRLWNPATGRRVGTTITATTFTAPSAPGQGVTSVAFNPAGTLLATASQDGTVRLWNPATGQPVGTAITASTNAGAVNGVAFNPTGALLATADDDGLTRLINVAWQTSAAPLLCKEFGLPSPAAWSQYAATPLAEPRQCP